MHQIQHVVWWFRDLHNALGRWCSYQNDQLVLQSLLWCNPGLFCWNQQSIFCFYLIAFLNELTDCLLKRNSQGGSHLFF